MGLREKKFRGILLNSALIGASLFSMNTQAGEGYFGWVYGLDLHQWVSMSLSNVCN